MKEDVSKRQEDAMYDKTHSTRRRWIEFQLVSIDAAELFEKLDHDVFVAPDTLDSMRISEPALDKIDHARIFVLKTANLKHAH